MSETQTEGDEMKITITKRWSADVVFETEVDTDNRRIGMGIAIKMALSQSVSLRGSNLSDSNLSGSDLSGSDLSGSDLSDSNLSGSDLSGSNLRGSDLSDSNLSDSNLRPIKDDMWAMLCYSPAEVPTLIAALKAGRVNGSVYSDGECGCLVGTLSIASGTDPHDKSACERVDGLKGNNNRPTDRFFMGIRRGDTPETNQVSALAVEWCEEWLSRMTAAFAHEFPAVEATR